jgi:hypothetical protein
MHTLACHGYPAIPKNEVGEIACNLDYVFTASPYLTSRGLQTGLLTHT